MYRIRIMGLALLAVLAAGAIVASAASAKVPPRWKLEYHGHAVRKGEHVTAVWEIALDGVKCSESGTLWFKPAHGAVYLETEGESKGPGINRPFCHGASGIADRGSITWVAFREGAHGEFWNTKTTEEELVFEITSTKCAYADHDIEFVSPFQGTWGGSSGNAAEIVADGPLTLTAGSAGGCAARLAQESHIRVYKYGTTEELEIKT